MSNKATEAESFGILIVTHGMLGSELLKAAQNIVGSDLKRVIPVSIGWNQDLDRAREKLKRALQKVGSEQGAIILTDMFGGTPTNISLTFLDDKNVEVITGVNLPILIKLASMQKDGADTTKAAHVASKRGRDTILVASEVLNGSKRPETNERK